MGASDGGNNIQVLLPVIPTGRERGADDASPRGRAEPITIGSRSEFEEILNECIGAQYAWTQEGCQPPGRFPSNSNWTLFIKPGVHGTGGRCHTPSGQVPEKWTAGGPETPPACAGVRQSGPLVRRLHFTGTATAGSHGPGHLPHPRLPSPLRCGFLVKQLLSCMPFKV